MCVCHQEKTARDVAVTIGHSEIASLLEEYERAWRGEMGGVLRCLGDERGDGECGEWIVGERCDVWSQASEESEVCGVGRREGRRRRTG